MTNRTYAEVIEGALEHFGDAVVMTNAYDQDAMDHLNELEGNDSEVHVLNDYYEVGGIRVHAWIVDEIDDDGYIETNTDHLAVIVSHNDYDRLGRE